MFSIDLLREFLTIFFQSSLFIHKSTKIYFYKLDLCAITNSYKKDIKETYCFLIQKTIH